MAAAETAFGGVVANTFVACEIIQSSDRVTAAADQLPGAILVSWSAWGAKGSRFSRARPSTTENGGATARRATS